MSPFRRVSDDRAGPNAVGILVPLCGRTVVIVRPRALAWDLVLLGPAGLAVQELERDDAALAARQLFAALEDWAGGGSATLTLLAADQGYLVRVDVGGHSLIACARRPGQAYRPAIFPSRAAAEQAAASLAAVLCPSEGRQQELYFNTQNFAR
jgi:hypothetical protein